MFDRILIANRGLIAANCVRAVKELGAQSIVVFEDDDRESAAVRNADEAYQIQATEAFPSPYLDIDQIVAVAEAFKVQAVHPGYGFLAQNADFAERLRRRGITVIAPHSQGVFDFSNKHLLKAAAARAGLPILPGSESFREKEWLFKFARAIGFPVAVKGAYGFGGLGIGVAHNEDELVARFDEVQALCTRHMMNSPDVFLEKYLPDVHHVEFPVLRDEFGRTVVFPELECSVQRRYQKLLVETPSSCLDDELRQRLRHEIYVLINRLQVSGFASVEFLVKDGHPYFLEINGYIQPSHTATCLLTGVDLLKEQIRLVAGGSPRLPTQGLDKGGHVIAAYIFAEDPDNDFAPSPGLVDRLYLPFGEEVFVQSSIFSGAQVSPRYDPMVAKVLVRALDRPESILRMGIALREFFVEGVKTNIPLLRAVVTSPEFANGQITASFLNPPETRTRLLEETKKPAEFEIAALIAALALHRDSNKETILAAASHEDEALGAASRWLRKQSGTRPPVG